MTTEQQKQAKDAHAALKGIPIDTLIQMGVSLVPILESAFKAIAAAFKNRIGLRAKVEEQGEKIEFLMAEVVRLTQSNEAAFKQIAELRDYISDQNSRSESPTLHNPNATWATWALSRGSEAHIDSLGEEHS